MCYLAAVYFSLASLVCPSNTTVGGPFETPCNDICFRSTVRCDNLLITLKRILLSSILALLMLFIPQVVGGKVALLPDVDTLWEEVPTAHTPSARYIHGMTYDSSRGVLVLFGGDGTGRERRNDTWEYNGEDWTQIQPQQSPPGRVNIQQGMVYDAHRQKVVLFGGLGVAGYLNDTWEYNGVTWTQASPATSPPARDSHAMVYDPVRRVIVLFGGYNPGNPYLNDTWEYNGVTWQQVTTAQSPPGRFHHALAYDAQRRVVVLYGGRSITDPQRNDTWEYNGSDWQQVVPGQNPPGLESHGMSYDAQRGVVVLFGGTENGSDPVNETWEYDGASWTIGSTILRPPARLGFPLAYDSQRDKLVLFGGGYGDGRPTVFADTWEYDEDTGPGNAIAQEARLDSGMPYDVDRGCPTPYTGCGGDYHGFSAGVCTDIILDAYNFGASFDLQQALFQDYLVNPWRYRYGTARHAEDLRRYFANNQQIFPPDQPYLKGDVVFLDWETDGLADHAVVVTQVSLTGRPQRVMDARGYTADNLHGVAAEAVWSSAYEGSAREHARLGTPQLSLPLTITETTQALRIRLNNTAISARLQDATGKQTSAFYDENMAASNIHNFIPYIPGGSYNYSPSEITLLVYQPLSNSENYTLDLTSSAYVTYTAYIETLQNSNPIESVAYTRTLASGETHKINIRLEFKQGALRLKSTSLAAAPTITAPLALEIRAQTGITATTDFTISETGSLLPLNNADLSATNLRNQAGELLPSARLSFSPDPFSLPAGGSQTVTLRVDLNGVLPGLYQGSVRMTSGNSSPLSIPLSVLVEPYRRYLPMLSR